MTLSRKTVVVVFLTSAVAYALLFAAVHLKNRLQVDHWWIVVKGDSVDSVFRAVSSPGRFVASFVFFFWFESVHDYPLILSDVAAGLINCLVYGLVGVFISVIVHSFRSGRRTPRVPPISVAR